MSEEGEDQSYRSFKNKISTLNNLDNDIFNLDTSINFINARFETLSSLKSFIRSRNQDVEKKIKSQKVQVSENIKSLGLPELPFSIDNGTIKVFSMGKTPKINPEKYKFENYIVPIGYKIKRFFYDPNNYPNSILYNAETLIKGKEIYFKLSDKDNNLIMEDKLANWYKLNELVGTNISIYHFYGFSSRIIYNYFKNFDYMYL